MIINDSLNDYEIDEVSLNEIDSSVDDSFVNLTEKVINRDEFISYSELNGYEKKFYDDLLKLIYS